MTRADPGAQTVGDHVDGPFRATSREQFEAFAENRTPGFESVSDGIWCVALPMPENYVRYTLCYLVEDDSGGIHLVDPGLARDENRALLAAALASVGSSLADVVSVTVTHLHTDHMGLADVVRRESGAPIALHRIEQEAASAAVTPDAEVHARWDRWGVPAERRPELEAQVVRRRGRFTGFTADILLEDGDVLDIPGRDVRVVWTPGHTYGHICLRDASSGVTFTGDHILPTIFPGLGLGGAVAGNPIADYLASLRRVSTFDGDEVAPGHGYRFTGLADRCATIEAHHLRRSAEVAAELAERPDATVWELASRVGWTAGWESLRDFFLASALAQTDMHVAYLTGADAQPA